MKKIRVLFVANMNSRWAFRYVKKMYFENLDITIVDYACQRLSMGNEYYEFCEKNRINIIAIYDEEEFSRTIKYAMLINQMEKFDVCHIMYLRTEACMLVRICEQKFNQIIGNFFGSDFYRVTKTDEQKQKYLIDISDMLIVPTDQMKEKVVLKYPEFQDRVQAVYFESPVFEMLETNPYIKDLDEKCLPSDKVIIAAGYNGNSGQQHDLFIRALNACSLEIKKRVFIVFTMTYGLTDEYEKYINELLNNVDFEFVIIKEYMTDEQIISLRKRIDIFVHPMITDAFSAALQESMFFQTVILMGSWLQYQLLEQEKACIYKFTDERDLSQKLEQIIVNYKEYRSNSAINKEIIKRIRSQRSHVEDWNVFYNTEKSKHFSGNASNVLEYVLSQEKRKDERKQKYNDVMRIWLKKRLENRKPINQFIEEKKYSSIVIYGAGTIGEMVYRELQDMDIIINICDKNIHKVDWFDKKIIYPSELSTLLCDCIIITPIHICNQIKESFPNIETEKLISLLDILEKS
ncbi:MAG: glycosyltransferase [Lachnospiraceae bacterium]